VDGTKYANVIISIRVAPGTAPTINGDYGTLDLGFTLDGWGQFHVADIHLPLAANQFGWSSRTPLIRRGPAGQGQRFLPQDLVQWHMDNQFNFSLDNIWLQAILPPTPRRRHRSWSPGKSGFGLAVSFRHSGRHRCHGQHLHGKSVLFVDQRHHLGDVFRHHKGLPQARLFRNCPDHIFLALLLPPRPQNARQSPNMPNGPGDSPLIGTRELVMCQDCRQQQHRPRQLDV